MKKYLIDLLVLILTLLFLTGNGFAQCENVNSLKVMTFNIRYDNQGDGENSWINRKKNVVSMFMFYDVDIFGTQEAIHHQKVYLDENLSEYKSVGVGREDGNQKGEYCAIYFKHDKFELLDSGTFWLSETPEEVGNKRWDAACERIATWVKLKTRNDDEFIFVNTHFDHRGEIARVESAKLIMSKINELAAKLPVILCGDFNITKSADAYNVLTSNNNMKLFDANFISEIPSHGPNWTFHGFRKNDGIKHKIDFIFVNKNIKVKKHAVLSDTFDSGYPSDHLPVYAELVLISN